MIASVPSDPDQQVRQVVADDVLHDLAAGLDDFAGRQDGLESEDVLLRRAVLEGARTAGTLGHVATDRRLPQRRGVRRVEEADALDGVLQIAGDDVGLDHGNEVDLVDLQDPVHPVHGQHDAAQARAPTRRCSRCRRRAGRSAGDAQRTRGRPRRPATCRPGTRRRPRDGPASVRRCRRRGEWSRRCGRAPGRRHLRAGRGTLGQSRVYRATAFVRASAAWR